MNLEDALNSLKEAFSGKSAEAEASAAKITALEESEKVALALVESMKGDKVALEAKVASLEADLAKAKELAAAAIEAQKAAESKVESAGKKAAAIAASVGVDPVEISPVQAAAVGKTDDEIAQEWAVLRQSDPKAASEFYTKNRTAIIRASGLR